MTDDTGERHDLADHENGGKLGGELFAGQRELELAPVRQAGQRVAARELAQAVQHLLQPGDTASRVGFSEHPSGLSKQLQRGAKLQRGSGI